MSTKEYNYRIVEVSTGKVIKRPATWHRKHKHCEQAAIAALDAVVDVAIRNYIVYKKAIEHANERATYTIFGGNVLGAYNHKTLRDVMRKYDGVTLAQIESKYNIIRLSRKAAQVQAVQA